jgi:site-specific DNA-methyltransferase (adenine-specific)
VLDVSLTPYYEDSAVRLYHGDCREVLPSVDPVAVTVTDPPYNAGKNYGETTNDRRDWPDWCAWWDGILTACLARSHDGVLAFLSQTAYRHCVRNSKHEMAWSAVWVKPLSMAVCAAPFMPHWEPIAYWGDKRRRRGDGEGWGSDVITANVEFGKERWNHPTPKPLEVMLALLDKVDGPILDPFAGSGTTLAAAKMLGKPAIGIEISEAYCEGIALRLTNTVPRFRATAHPSLFADEHLSGLTS